MPLRVESVTHSLGSFELCKLSSAVNLDACTENLDLVRVHCYKVNLSDRNPVKACRHTGVRDQDFRVFQSFWAVDANCFVQDET